MEIGIVSESRDWVTYKLEKVMRDLNITPVYIKPSRISTYTGMDIKFEYRGKDILQLDALFLRDLGDTANYYSYDVLKFIEHYIPVINPTEVLENCGNKFKTSVLLDINKVPHPRTLITGDIDKAIEWIEEVGECVLKPIFGNGGEGLYRLKNRSPNTLNLLREYRKRYNVLYLQEFIDTPGEEYRDIRVFVVGEEVVAGMYRISNNWITNIHQSGRAEQCEITPEIENIGLKAKKALGILYGGIDIIEDREGNLQVLEVNGAPSWKALSKVSQIDITRRLVEYILEYIS
ncbi:MAG TPA: RimK family alpha-L-glutamate ligase [Methanothermococcus okinawensis]|uniref:RimK family alpha-L-glutamate ligase n=1 Tax=Methanothermococcus okinawensis TaxID=155863 RepID=A0A832Z8M3_9EURY|nr:RimK family alpha-L-glutamate ligase [Methanothermococcus okinawensis]HIP91581.1 RimK family alpha-L-glutamate ligase [Methanothermococcus okinawensis]